MSRHVEDRPRRSKKKIAAVGVGGLALAGVAFIGIGYAATGIPPADALATGGSTLILYSDGSEIGRSGAANRIPITLDKVPQHVQEAVLSAEDRGFYTEPGISPKGIARALLTNVRGGGDIQQGGSTITQQYAKNAYLTSERTYTRKVKEVFLALKLTQKREKTQILEDYLNTIYFGRGAYGIEVASSTYFGKPAEQLTIEEGAVLAATIRSPAAYDPERHPERAKERFDYVLDGMVEQDWLEQGARTSAQYPAVLPGGQGNANNDLTGPKGHVITQVLEELGEKGFDEARLAAGGLSVRTTLRRPAQEAAVRAVQDIVGDGSDPAALQGALVSVEPGTGAVVAYYGGGTGRGFDFANQGGGRQPGSSFKPYALAAALENDIGLRTRLDGNSPKEFPGDVEIDNFGDEDHGRVDLVKATEDSINTAYFELGLEVGPAKIADLAHRAGIPREVPLGEPAPEGGIALGQYEVHVIDQAVGYATFAAEGMRAEPYMVQAVLDGEGEEIYTAEVVTERAFEEDVAADATFAMQQVVQSGTGTRARLTDRRPVAGKTGTSSENKDAWFVGFVPQLSTAVWLGYGESRTIEIDGVEVTGGGFSTRIWKSYMDVAVDGMEVERFPERANIGRERDVSPATSSPQPRRST
ncbi:MAG: penicillin-binding protein, partial [Actinomycetota bacterium]|nr:penicillin-binding protein [Actinomycetota bacterium]